MNDTTGWLRKLVRVGLILIVVVAPTQYAFEVARKTYLSIVDPLVWIVGLLWAIDVLRTSKLRSVAVPSFPAALFVFCACASALVAGNRMAALKDIFQFVEYFIAVYMLFTSAMDSRKVLSYVLYAFLGAATLVVALGLVQYFDGELDTFAVRATFGNRNVLGGFLALALPLALGLLVYERTWWRAAWYALLILAGLPLCLAGGSLIAVVTAFVVVAAFRGHVALVATILVCVAVAAFVSPRLPRDTVEDARRSIVLFDDDLNVSPRYTEWQAATIMMLENPLLGVGTGNYQSNIGQYYGVLPDAAGRKSEADSQNLYLVIGSSMGIGALLVFLGMLARFTGKAARGFYQSTMPYRKSIFLGCFGSLLAFAVNGVWAPLIVRGIGVPLAVIFSLTVALHRLAGRKE